MAEYHAHFKRVADIDAGDREKIAALYLSHYDGSSKERVVADLANKTEILLLHHGNTLVGFTTLQLYDFEWQGAVLQVVYSGDTVVHHAHWGQQALAFAWIGNLGKLKRERPDLPLYWFVIIKGHRTYKFLPTFGKSFYPHWSVDRSDLKPLADALATEKFGNAYLPQNGIVKFEESHGHLNPRFGYPSEQEKSKEAVRFFLEKNPGYLRGDELVCLCEISEDNMRPLTKRIFERSSE